MLLESQNFFKNNRLQNLLLFSNRNGLLLKVFYSLYCQKLD